MFEAGRKKGTHRPVMLTSLHFRGFIIVSDASIDAQNALIPATQLTALFTVTQMLMSQLFS